MSSSTQRYPLSTPDGVAIPLEVIKAHSLVKKSFLSASATAALTVPADVELMMVSATRDCIIRFGAAASVPADGVALADAVYVYADMVVFVAPHLSTFTIIGAAADGSAVIQYLQKWAGLALSTQYSKR